MNKIQEFLFYNGKARCMSRKGIDPTEPHDGLQGLYQTQEFCEGKVYYLIKGIIIHPMSSAWLKMNLPFQGGPSF